MPKVLFLDEPTIGLDVTARTTIRNVLKEQSEQHGQTILLTSHDTGDMERLCDRVIVIHKGRIMLDQSIDELRRNYIRRKHVKLRMSEEKIALHLAGTRILKALPHQIEMEVELNVTPVDAVVQRVMGLTKLLDLTVADPPMEEIIRTIYTCADSDQELPKPKNSSNKMAGALS